MDILNFIYMRKLRVKGNQKVVQYLKACELDSQFSYRCPLFPDLGSRSYPIYYFYYTITTTNTTILFHLHILLFPCT